MFVHVRSNADNCRISGACNGQQEFKQLNVAAAEEGAKQGSLLFIET